MPAGRPTKYTTELADEICRMLAVGMSMREVSEQEGMPGENTMWDWKLRNEEFSGKYARAKEAAMHYMADELIRIADDGTNDWMQRNRDDENEAWTINGEHVQRSRLRVDTRKWVMARLAPKNFGDKQTLEHQGQDGGPIQTITRTIIDPASS